MAKPVHRGYMQETFTLRGKLFQNHFDPEIKAEWQLLKIASLVLPQEARIPLKPLSNTTAFI